MGQYYEQLKTEEWATVMRMEREESSVRAMVRASGRSPSTVSRDLARHRVPGQSYDATRAVTPARAR